MSNTFIDEMAAHESASDYTGYSPRAIAAIMSTFCLIYAASIYWTISTGEATTFDTYLAVLAVGSAIALLTLSRWGLVVAIIFLLGMLVRHSTDLGYTHGDGDLLTVIFTVFLLLVLIFARDAFLSRQ